VEEEQKKEQRKGMVGREIELEGKAIKALRNYLAVRTRRYLLGYFRPAI
jgi:hypothetical protein